MMSFPPSWHGNRWSDEDERRAEHETEREEAKMPQYDTDPSILRERCYAMAMELCAVELGSDAEDFEEISDYDLGEAREQFRQTLLDEFQDIDGPEISRLMDEGLSDIGFPLWRVT
jgi:predicted transposase YdaD